MPLPTTPDVRVAPHNHRAPPFMSSAGNVYVVGRNPVPDLDEVRCFKSVDPTEDSNWTEQDAAGNPDNGGNLILAMWAEQNGDLIHIVTQHNEAAGMSTNSVVEYHRFNMATDNWDTVNENVDDAPDIDSEPYGDGTASVTIIPFDDDDSMIAFQDTHASIMGTDYQRVSRIFRSAGGSYTGLESFDVPGGNTEGSFWLNAAIRGVENERVHYFLGWRDGDANSDWQMWHQSVIGAADSTIQTIDTSTTDNINKLGHGISYDDDGSSVCRIANWRSGIGVYEFPDVTQPSFSKDTNAHEADTRTNKVPGDADDQRAQAHIALAYEAAFRTEYMVWTRESDDNVYWSQKPLGGGDGWATSIALTSGGNRLDVSATVYLRDGAYRLAFLRDENATPPLYYDEVNLGLPLPHLHMQPLQPAAGGVT